MISRLAISVLLAGFVLNLAPQAHAQMFERLVMPGRVIEGHADVENDCSVCHAPDSEAASSSLCTSCHEDIGDDREIGRGFHGLFPAAKNSECVSCHTDHEGRDADIVNLDAGLFDHAFTDFPLGGSHVTAACADCHAPDAVYRVAPTNCGSCHAQDDVHEGALGDDCGSCHTDKRWQGAEFDHSTTGYPLTGSHIQTACADCHRDNRYENTPTSCNSCHAIDDVHTGSKGPACQDCHSTTTWQDMGFDHFGKTGFALRDGHANLACNDCHTRDDYKDDFRNGCVDCHLTDDDHQGRNGTACADCHRPTRWSDSLFDHSDTGFHLVEAHAVLQCSSCHKESSADQVRNTCSSCHVMDDSHGGQMEAECSTCHTQSSWHASIRFDHDLSLFPLTGLHATVACGSCHESNRFHDADPGCASCHKGDDAHEGSLGDDCGSCHNPNGWNMVVFDHDAHTNFPLEGRHEGLDCGACHRSESASADDVPSTCRGCHTTDDVHDGEFGNDCGQCHTTWSFKEVMTP